MRLMSRTMAAFTLSAERLAGEFKHSYFWTFTFKSVPINDEYAMEDYADFRRRLCNYWPSLQGLRVAELHRSHGIHFHALVNMRIPIQRVKRIAAGKGRINGRNRYLDFGRMSVTACDGGTIGYMAKYLTKQYQDDNNFGGRRRWGVLGGFEQTRCADIEYDSPFHRNKPLMFGQTQLDYSAVMLLAHYSTMWGDLENWPADAKVKVMNFATRTGKDGRETIRREPNRLRIDAPALIWNGHIERCGQCKYGYGLCKRGAILWDEFIYTEWRFAEKTTDPEMLQGVTNADRAISEVEERDSEKIFRNESVHKSYTSPSLCKENGQWVYVLNPWAEYQDRTRIDPF